MKYVSSDQRETLFSLTRSHWQERDKYLRSHVVILTPTDLPAAVISFVKKPFFRRKLWIFTGDPTVRNFLTAGPGP